jgi:hypothetical protein
MATIEPSACKIVAWLMREGWRKVGNYQHYKFEHLERPSADITPRHRKPSIGTTRWVALDLK